MSLAIVPTVLDSSLFIPELKLRRKESVLQDLVARAREAGAIRDVELLRETLLARERLGNTGIGKGVAVPNTRSLAVIEPRLVVARSRRGIVWDAPDGLPVQLVLLALSPAESGEEAHLDLVTRAVQAARLQRNRQRLIEAETFETVAAVLRDATS